MGNSVVNSDVVGNSGLGSSQDISVTQVVCWLNGAATGLSLIVIISSAVSLAWVTYFTQCISEMVSLKSIYPQTRQLNFVTMNSRYKLTIPRVK